MESLTINNYELYDDDREIVYDFTYEEVEGQYIKKQLDNGAFINKVTLFEREAYWGNLLTEDEIFSSFNAYEDEYFLQEFENMFKERIPVCQF